MSYALLDDGFPGHPKIVPLSDQAFRVHTTALCHVRRYRTGGFIAQGSEVAFHPRRLTPRAWAGVLAELESGRGSPTGSPLWERVEGGWRVHDHEHWFGEDPEAAAAGRQEQDERRRELSRKRAEAGRKGGQRSAEQRSRVAPSNPEQLATEQSKQVAPSKTEQTPRADARPPAHVRARPSEPEPDSEPESEQSPPKDLEGPGGAGGQAGCLCPADLSLTEDQSATAELNIGIPRWAIAALTAHLVGMWCDGETRRPSVGMWRRQLFAAIRSEWSDPKRRPQKPEEPDAATLAARRARDRMEAEARERASRGAPDVATTRAQAAQVPALLEGVG
ncbi:MAG: hypothetical protein AMXMBFR56_66070 [Polyangiaceae bacterium]